MSLVQVLVLGAGAGAGAGTGDQALVQCGIYVTSVEAPSLHAETSAGPAPMAAEMNPLLA
jgi:hypothetical protein